MAGQGGPGPLRLPDPPLVDAAAGIRLRPWEATDADADALAAAWQDPAVAAANPVPADRSPVAAARWLGSEPRRRAAGVALDLVACPLAGPPVVLGEVGLRNVDGGRGRAEVGWWVAADHRGRGVARAAVRLLVDWALDRAGLVQVWARVAPGNTASAQVAAAAGLARLGAAGGADVWARGGPVPR
jgi:RimJ/RimL family protein N-acetyltransferase